MHDGQAQPRADSDRLGREERLEHALERGAIHADAGVRHLEHRVGGAVAAMGAAQHDRQHAAALAHRVGGVGAEVHQHLVQLHRIGLHRRHRVVDLDADLDHRGQRRAQDAGGLADDRRHRHHVALFVAPAAEGENLPDQGLGPRRRALDLIQVRPGGMPLRHVGGGEVGAAGDQREDVVEVVGDAAGERADRLHLLRVAQAGFELRAFGLGPAAVGDVADAGQQAAVAGGQRREHDVHRHRVAGRRTKQGLEPGEARGGQRRFALAL